MRLSPIHRFKIPLAIASWLSFAISLTFYWITADPGASYWDCPEYITVASKMEVGHPPGNPIWMLAMRVATIPFSPQNHAYVINLCSGLFMAFATFFLCRIIFIPSRLFLQRKKISKKFPKGFSDFLAICVSLGASLCYALCDSAWYSAIEAEVYAMSAFLSSATLWIITVWWHTPSKGGQTRLLILIAYLLGISLGVHQLNLLLIPVLAIIILYKKFPQKINPLLVFAVFIGATLFIGFILMGLLPALLAGAGNLELIAVNQWGMPYHSGVIIYFCLLLFLFICFQYFYINYKDRISNGSSFFYALSNFMWGIAFLILGFSSYGIILIRAQASPPMNEGSPSNIFALSSYFSRDQYPKTPLVYGHTPYSRPMLKEEFKDAYPYYSRYVLQKGKAKFQPWQEGAQLDHRSGLLSHHDSLMNNKIIEQKHGYLLADYDFQQKLTPELDMWFPRITSRNPADRTAYEDWSGFTDNEIYKTLISEAYDSLGNPVSKMDKEGERIQAYSYRPSYYQNLKFFIAYQAYYMYFRYLFWNFIGRQNDYPSMGEIEHGNFITSISYIDKNFLGDTDALPNEIGSDNPGRHKYYGIPFILGILGIIGLWSSGRKNRRLLIVVTTIFIMTGIAIVFYLNQTPGEPRERDYTFLVSYMAFSMWIAAGLLFMLVLLLKKMAYKKTIAIVIILTMGIPTMFAVENFKNNDRRGRFQTTFYASSILDFEYPSIIFSHGDNSTFPMWYASEVLGMGRFHTPIDITYLALPAYVDNLKKQGDRGINTIGNSAQLSYGKYLLSKLPDNSDSSPMTLRDALQKLYESKASQWPTSLILIKGPNTEDVVIDLHDFSKGSHYLPFRSLMLLDLMATQMESLSPKLLFFPSVIDHSFYSPLDTILRPTLFGKIYAPWLSDSIVRKIQIDAVFRELDKISKLKTANSSLTSYYSDPTTSDRTRRYRGELLIAANEIMTQGDSSISQKIADAILEFLPYDKLLPGDFTIADTTYFEGSHFTLLLENLHQFTGERKYLKEADKLDSLIRERQYQWLMYYRSLPPSQRPTISNRSRRLMRRPKL